MIGEHIKQFNQTKGDVLEVLSSWQDVSRVANNLFNKWVDFGIDIESSTISDMFSIQDAYQYCIIDKVMLMLNLSGEKTRETIMGILYDFGTTHEYGADPMSFTVDGVDITVNSLDSLAEVLILIFGKTGA